MNIRELGVHERPESAGPRAPYRAAFDTIRQKTLSENSLYHWDRDHRRIDTFVSRVAKWLKKKGLVGD